MELQPLPEKRGLFGGSLAIVFLKIAYAKSEMIFAPTPKQQISFRNRSSLKKYEWIFEKHRFQVMVFF